MNIILFLSKKKVLYLAIYNLTKLSRSIYHVRLLFGGKN